jgi:DNA helicase HerA-like ATPase
MNPEDVQELIKNISNLNTTYLGTRTSQLGVEENVGIDDEKRPLNVLNVGPIGFGKTQLMAHAILQDIRKGYGVAVVNPKGGLHKQIISKMPENRHDDIIYINPGREEVTPINVLDAPVTDGMSMPQKENQKEIVVSDLIAIFKRYSENWGDRFGRVIETLLRAHLDLNIYHGEKNTLLDVFEAASSKDTLGDLIDRTRDDVLHEELVTIKEELTDREMEPAVRRLKDFVENKTVKRVIDSRESGVDFRNAVNNGKIILVDIQKGEIGSVPAQLIGTLAITSIWAAVQNRITTPAEKRTPFYLYIDELQNFAQEGSSLKTILAECREYGMGLWIASQYLNQLSPEMRRAVTNNCRTKIFFNPSGSEDVSAITGMLRGINRTQLTGLGKYRAVLQAPSEGQYSDATIFDTYPPFDGFLTDEEIEAVKQKATQPGESQDTSIERGTGETAASGGEEHDQLLKERVS